MCNSAAFLVDHVIPEVPLRQWVLSVPYELRLVLAKRTDALNYVGRALVNEVFRWQLGQAHARGFANARCGAIEWPQRFGGSLNLNVHYHLAVPDGVFTRSAAHARAEFHRLPPPRQDALEDIAVNVWVRVERWLRRKRLVVDGDEALFNNETPEVTPLDACLEGSLGIGELTSLREAGDFSAQDAAQDTLLALPKPSKTARRCGHCRGFDVHAGVVVSASDREGRERLLRYCARPPLSLERLSVTKEGLVAYRSRKPFSRTETHRIMTPIQFLARLCALVPPPRCPLVRFHGVFGPRSSWRASVVAGAPGATAGGSVNHSEGHHQHGDRRDGQSDRPSCPRNADPSGSSDRGAKEVGQALPDGERAEPRNGNASATPVTSNNTDQTLPVDARMRRSSRIDWHTLLRRVHDVDSLACPCGGRLEFISLVTDEKTAKEFLISLGLPSEPPPVMRAGGAGIDYADRPARAGPGGSADFDVDPPPRDWD